MDAFTATNACPTVFIAETKCSAVKMGYAFSCAAACAPLETTTNTTIRAARRSTRAVDARRRLGRIGERRQPAGAVAELLDRHAKLLENRHMQVCERRPLGMPHVAAAD